MTNFGERLRALRRDRGINQADFASQLGISERALQNYETGEREPKLSFIRDCAKYLGVNSSYLVGDSDDPTPPSGSEPDDEGPSPEDMAFFEWIKEHVTGMQFYDFQKSKEDGDWIKGLRLVYEKEKGRKPGQKQGE